MKMLQWNCNFRNIIAYLIFMSASIHTFNRDALVEKIVKRDHIIDSLNLLIYILLLVLTIITVWIFKHRRIRFLHESGLAIFYGLVIGAIIKYSTKPDSNHIPHVIFTNVSANYTNSVPVSIWLSLVDSKNSSSKDAKYTYRLRNVIAQSNPRSITELEIKATFDSEIFFNILLPPIIFNAGFSLTNRKFFRNFGSIITFAFLGTLISTAVFASFLYIFLLMWPNLKFAFIDCLYFGAIISATDPVTVLSIFNDLNVDLLLYALVFGESMFNDAVAVILTDGLEKYVLSAGSFGLNSFLQLIVHFVTIFVGSFFIGTSVGLLNSLLTKFTNIREFYLLESALFVLMSYSSYLVSELCEMSGIVSSLFCGICQAHYTHNNLSTESKDLTAGIFGLLNFLMENFIFCYIGASMFTFSSHIFHWGLIISSFICIILSRIANIYPLSLFLNLGRKNKIKYETQHMLMFSGLRGAMAFALAIRNTSSYQRQAIYSTTSIIAIITVIFCGGMTTQMLTWLNIPVGLLSKKDEGDDERLAFNKRSVANSDKSALISTKSLMFKKWFSFDRLYLMPFFTHSLPSLVDTLPTFLSPLAKLLSSKKQLNHNFDSLSNNTSISDIEIEDNSRRSSSKPRVQETLPSHVVNHVETFPDIGDLGLGNMQQNNYGPN